MRADHIVAMIEEELERLRHVRAVLLPLCNLPRAPRVRMPVAKSVTMPVDPPMPSPTPVLVRLPAREPRRRRIRTPKQVEQPTALRGSIPSAPVVFRPTAPKQIVEKPSTHTVVERGSFAALVRAAERELQSIA